MTDELAVEVFNKARFMNKRAKETEGDMRTYYYKIKNALVEKVAEERPDLLTVFEVGRGKIGLELRGVGGLHITFKDIRSPKALSALALLMRQKNWPEMTYMATLLP